MGEFDVSNIFTAYYLPYVLSV